MSQSSRLIMTRKEAIHVIKELWMHDSYSELKGKASLLGGGLRLIHRQVITTLVGMAQEHDKTNFDLILDRKSQT